MYAKDYVYLLDENLTVANFHGSSAIILAIFY